LQLFLFATLFCEARFFLCSSLLPPRQICRFFRNSSGLPLYFSRSFFFLGGGGGSRSYIGCPAFSNTVFFLGVAFFCSVFFFFPLFTPDGRFFYCSSPVAQGVGEHTFSSASEVEFVPFFFFDLVWVFPPFQMVSFLIPPKILFVFSIVPPPFFSPKPLFFLICPAPNLSFLRISLCLPKCPSAFSV